MEITDAMLAAALRKGIEFGLLTDEDGPYIRQIFEAALAAADDVPESRLEAEHGRALEAESALRAFVEYYDQAGMPRKLTAKDEANPPERFDGDEVFNVRLGRDVLRKAAGLDAVPGEKSNRE